MTNVRFSTIDNGARSGGRPYIQSNVDGVRVRWDVRHGWRCDACGISYDEVLTDEGVTLVSGVFQCSHALATEDHLSRRIRDRIKHLVDVNAVGRAS